MANTLPRQPKHDREHGTSYHLNRDPSAWHCGEWLVEQIHEDGGRCAKGGLELTCEEFSRGDE